MIVVGLREERGISCAHSNQHSDINNLFWKILKFFEGIDSL